MAERPIASFEQDQEGDWLARLSCGHPQHLRHKPPFQDREWVTREEGRAAMIGQTLDCLFCNMPSLPEEARVYKSTREFDQESVPAGLLRDHRTRENTWARIEVLEGLLLYSLSAPETGSWVLRPGVCGIVAPTQVHRVKCLGAVRFRVDFLRVNP